MTSHLGRRLLAAAAASLALLAAAPAAQAGTEPYLGEIMITLAHQCPTGWEPADGRLKQVSTNSALFSLLGTNFGGDGQTTFALPDLRGRTVVGAGRSMASDTPLGADAMLGQKGGAEQTLLPAMQPPVQLGPSAKTAAGGTISGAVPGAGLPIATMPPWIGLTACIATTGYWPARPRRLRHSKRTNRCKFIPASAAPLSPPPRSVPLPSPPQPKPSNRPMSGK